MDLTIGVVTDIHFGPAATFEGKLRKLTDRAPALLEAFVERMNRDVRPGVVVNLGDDIEDETLDLDRERYRRVVDILGGCEAEVIHVAGNHDNALMTEVDLARAWNDPQVDAAGAVPKLYRSRDVGGAHLVMLHTHEEKDQRVFVEAEQLAWLEQDLAATNLPTIVFMHHSAADQVLVGNRWFEGRPHICLVQERKRLREIFEASGKVLLVVNGHLHWNHLDVHRGIPYVTVQSLIENLDDDAPGRPARANAIVRVERSRVLVEIEGEERARYQLART
ncbi:MAG: phosphoesterase [Polyangiaceae bacterium]|nr:phosphoesterase [Polyangiaceae bacterium]